MEIIMPTGQLGKCSVNKNERRIIIQGWRNNAH